MFQTLKVRHFFTNVEKEAIIREVQQAEDKTSGEIRVHVEGNCGPDPLSRAQAVFQSLGMDQTALHNGVLIYLAVKDRKFAIIGDSGIDQAVPANFWNDVKEQMASLFGQKKFSEGVCLGVQMAGEHLAKYFPYLSGDRNELPDDISEGK